MRPLQAGMRANRSVPRLYTLHGPQNSFELQDCASVRVSVITLLYGCRQRRRSMRVDGRVGPLLHGEDVAQPPVDGSGTEDRASDPPSGGRSRERDVRRHVSSAMGHICKVEATM